METEVSCDLRFNFLTLRLPRPFCRFKKFELARNCNMLSLLVTHTMNRYSHKYLIDLSISHMIQYSSDYGLRFPRKRSWFESQLGNNILFFVVVFFLFAFVVFILIFFSFFIFNRIDNPPTSAFRYKITEGSRYFVLCTEIQSFLCSYSSCLHNSNF